MPLSDLCSQQDATNIPMVFADWPQSTILASFLDIDCCKRYASITRDTGNLFVLRRFETYSIANLLRVPPLESPTLEVNSYSASEFSSEFNRLRAPFFMCPQY